MLYDLIAPSAVLDAVVKNEGKDGLGELISTRMALAEPESEEDRDVDDARYASMVATALGVARQASLSALGQLDITLASEATAVSIEARAANAQEALNQFGDDGEREWSPQEFAKELSDRGFPSEMAHAHAEAFAALADPGVQGPEGLMAAMEIHMDADSKKMSGASLYIGRKDARKIAHADIQWSAREGALVPQANISISYLH